MRQAVMTAPGKIQIRQVDAPSPGPGQVLLRIKRIGICGSDVHVWRGKHPYTSYPVVQGHEFCAIVEQTGRDVKAIGPGMKVTSLPQICCGTCGPCRRGDYHICDTLKVEGFQAPGCAQDLFVTAAEKIIPLPDDFTFEQGALVEPAAVAIHAVTRAGQISGKNVAVLGAGPIGNLVAQVARSEGANVLITDLSDYRLEVTAKCDVANRSNAGTETLSDASAAVFGPDGFDVAFECVGAELTIEAAIQTIAKGGTIVVVGVFGERPRVDIGLVQDRELQLRGTLMYQHADYQRAVELIRSGAIITDPLISKHFPLTEYAAAYEYIIRTGDKTMKVFIDL